MSDTTKVDSSALSGIVISAQQLDHELCYKSFAEERTHTTKASSLIGMSFLSRFKVGLNEKHPAASSEMTDQMGLSNWK